MAVAQNESLADLSVRGSDSYSGLNPTEKLRFENLMNERFWCWHSIWDGAQLAAFESDFWSGGKHLITRWLKQPGIAEWWDMHKFQFPPEFIAEIDGLGTNYT